MKKTFLILLSAVAISAAVAAAEGYNPVKPVAKIDGRPAVAAGDLVSYFERVTETAAEGYKPSAENVEDLRGFLLDIINGRVVALEGRKRGLDQDPAFRKDVEAYVSTILRERMRERIRAGIVIPEEDIRKHYDMNAEWRKISYIVCDKKEQAEAASAALTAGTPWDDVCKEYSVAPNKDQSGKDDRTLYYSGDDLSRTTYETPVGSFTPVMYIAAENCWVIFRVDEKVPGRTETYEESRPRILDNMTESLYSEKLKALQAEWRTTAKITVDQAMYDLVVSGHLKEAREKYNRQATPQVISYVEGIPVHFETWFEGLALDGWGSEEMMEEESLKDNTRLKGIMDRRLSAFQDEALMEAASLASGTLKDPEVQKDIRDYEDRKLVDEMYNKDFVPKIPVITDADIQAYYDGHLVDFQTPEHAEVYIVGALEETKTRELLKRVRKGEDIAAVGDAWVKEYFENESKMNPGIITAENLLPIGEKVDIDRIAPDPIKRADSPYGADLRDKVFAAQPGDLVGPFQIGDRRWAFFKYLALVPMYQKPLSDESVRRDSADLAKQERIASPETDTLCMAWFSDLRALHKIKIDEKVLRQVWEKVKSQ